MVIPLILGAMAVLFGSSLDDAKCIVYINTGLNNPEPLFLRPNYELWIPNGPTLNWNEGESTPIACPGNSIANARRRTAMITCVRGTTFLLNGQTVDIRNVRCNADTQGSVRNTGQACGDGGVGTLLNVGFEVDIQGFSSHPVVGFVPYFKSCYNINKASVIYTRHEIAGAAMVYKLTGGVRPDFNAAGIPTDVHPRTAYSQLNQEPRFTQLLGSEPLAKSYIKVKLRPPSILTRGHLTPDADGIFRSWRWATYFYVNAAPQWRATNAGNWQAVEDAARTVSIRLNEEVLVFTGAHDILTLPNVDGQQVEITLEDDKIQVPKWYWKIIKSPSKDAGIALVSYNNPYNGSMPAEEMLCEDICNQHGWSNPMYRIPERGYTYCCKVDDLRQAIHGIPAEAHAAYVLRYDGTRS